MDSENDPFGMEPDGVRLAVRLTPRAHRNRLDGVVVGADGRPALHLRLVAPPVEGAANKALIAFVAEALDMRNADVGIRSGDTARLKMLFLHGDAVSIVKRLRDWISKAGL